LQAQFLLALSAALRSEVSARLLDCHKIFGREPNALPQLRNCFKTQGPIGALALFLRYGENSGDSMHAEPQLCTSCHHQIFF